MIERIEIQTSVMVTVKAYMFSDNMPRTGKVVGRSHNVIWIDTPTEKSKGPFHVSHVDMVNAAPPAILSATPPVSPTPPPTEAHKPGEPPRIEIVINNTNTTWFWYITEFGGAARAWSSVDGDGSHVGFGSAQAAFNDALDVAQTVGLSGYARP